MSLCQNRFSIPDCKKISILDWPENSPKFNPIENLLPVLRNKVSKRHQVGLRVWNMPSKKPGYVIYQLSTEDVWQGACQNV